MMIRRTVLVIALVATVAFALALALAWAKRTALAERWLLQQLAARGVSPVSLRVADVDLHGVELEDLSIGAADAPDLAVATLAARWTLDGLRQGRIDALRVSGLRMRIALREDGLALGALAPLVGDGGETGIPLAQPASEIELRDARVSLETAEGAAECSFEGGLKTAGDAAIAGEFTLRVEHPLLRANGAVAVSGALEDLVVDLSLALRDGRDPARVAPATLTGRVSGAPASLVFDLALDGANGRLHAEAHGRADLPARSGRAKLRLAPLVLDPEGLQLETLLPALEPLIAKLGIEGIAGRFEARGTLALDAGEPALRLDVALREIGLQGEIASASGLAGVIALRAPPLHTAKGQLVSIAQLDVGVILSEGVTEFEVLPGGVVELRSSRWRFAGGELVCDALRIDAEAASTPVLVQARGLDLSALLALAAFEGLEGTGRIDGELPLVRRGDELLVAGGVLRATGDGGRLRYQPSAAMRVRAEARPGDLGLAVAAFSDFRYELLEARVDGDLRGALRVALHVRGANPEFKSGQPIELNLNLEARLADLVRGGVAAYRVPELVEERLRAFTEKAKKAEREKNR